MSSRRLALAVVCAALAALAAGCKRSKPPLASRVWLGPSGGCVETFAHPTSGTFACWGINDAGQLGDGTTDARPFATKRRFDAGEVTGLALGDRHSCAIFGGQKVACWGDGRRGQLGSPTPSSLVPIELGDPGGAPALAVEVGDEHTCVRSARGGVDELRCFGADDEGQLGGSEGQASPWSRGAPIRALALGAAHTCVAYGRGVAANAPDASPEALAEPMVLCRGRAVAAPREPLLGSAVVKELSAGGDQTCALLEDATLRCWGKNGSGQLGDGTTRDSLSPVAVAEVRDAAQIAVGLRHACALLRNGTVACWGDNRHHQLASGTTESSSRPKIVVGLLKAREIVAAGDGTCARLEGGYVRCWGANERGQLGDPTTTEQTVPTQLRFR